MDLLIFKKKANLGNKMVCPVCPTAGWLGGWVGGYFGVLPPKHSKGRFISAFITANLMSITIIALKKIFNVSLCKGGGWTLHNIVQVGTKALILGIIYSIGVNYLLNRYMFPAQSNQSCAPEYLLKETCTTCSCTSIIKETSSL